MTDQQTEEQRDADYERGERASDAAQLAQDEQDARDGHLAADWRGVAAEAHEDVTERASLVLRDRSRRLLGSLLRPHKKTLLDRVRGRAGRERRPAVHPLPGRGRHRQGHPADAGGRGQPGAAHHHRRGAGQRRRAGGVPPDLPHHERHGGTTGAARAAAPGVPALPAAQPGLPRPLHLRPRHQPPHVRRRRDRRDARHRVRRADQRRPDPRRHVRAAAGARSRAGPGGAVQPPVPALADQLVPAPVVRRLPAYPRDRRRRHRALRRVHDRHPRRPGVPPGASQRGDLRRGQHRLPRRQHARVPAGRAVHAGHQADRQPHHRRRADLRHLPRVRRCGDHRCAGGVPHLPAPVLRADAGHQPVLQHLPVGQRGAGEAVRGPRGGARRGRAGDAGAAAGAAGRGAVRQRALRLRRGPSGSVRPRPRAARRADAGGGRRHGCRQDHDRQAGGAVLRPHGRPGDARRRRPARPRRADAAQRRW